MDKKPWVVLNHRGGGIRAEVVRNLAAMPGFIFTVKLLDVRNEFGYPVVGYGPTYQAAYQAAIAAKAALQHEGGE